MLSLISACRDTSIRPWALYNTPAMFRLIFWIFVLLLALSFFGISLQAVINSPAGQANFAYAYDLILQAWHWLVTFATQFKV